MNVKHIRRRRKYGEEEKKKAIVETKETKWITVSIYCINKL